MKVFIDHRLIQKVLASEISEEMLLDACIKSGFFSKEHKLQMSLTWGSLFEYLELHVLFENYPQFNQDPFFIIMIAAINENVSAEILMDLYDQLFANCLTEVKGMSQVNAAFLLDKFKNQTTNPLFSLSSSMFKNLIINDPYPVIHELTLYLGFDRMCVSLSAIFEEPKLKNTEGLKVLMDCLIESFQHITAQGTAPVSMFRLIETFYAYQMRDENLDNHSEADWLTLCKGSECLRPRDQMIDVEYIDQALKNEPIIVLTSDSEDKFKASRALADYMIRANKLECTLTQVNIVRV